MLVCARRRESSHTARSSQRGGLVRSLSRCPAPLVCSPPSASCSLLHPVVLLSRTAAVRARSAEQSRAEDDASGRLEQRREQAKAKAKGVAFPALSATTPHCSTLESRTETESCARQSAQRCVVTFDRSEPATLTCAAARLMSLQLLLPCSPAMSVSAAAPAAPAHTAAAVQFLLTARMRSAFRQCKQRMEPEQKRAEEFQQLADVFRADALVQTAQRALAQKPAATEENATMAPAAPAPRFTLTFAQVQLLSRLYRATLAADDAASTSPADADAASADASTDDASPGLGFVHELLQDSSVAPLAPLRSGRVQDPAFKRYLQEQRWKQDRREYNELVKDLPGNKLPASEDPSIGAGVKAASRDIGHGINIISLMITGFVVFYYIGSNLFPHNHIFAVLCGLLGLVGALMVEVCLFLVREQKQEMGEVQQIKMARAQKARAEEIMAQKHEQARAQAEIERRAKVVREQQRNHPAAVEEPQENKMD